MHLWRLEMSSENLETAEVVDSEIAKYYPLGYWYSPIHHDAGGVSIDGGSTLNSIDSGLVSPLTY